MCILQNLIQSKFNVALLFSCVKCTTDQGQAFFLCTNLCSNFLSLHPGCMSQMLDSQRVFSYTALLDPLVSAGCMRCFFSFWRCLHFCSWTLIRVPFQFVQYVDDILGFHGALPSLFDNKKSFLSFLLVSASSSAPKGAINVQSCSPWSQCVLKHAFHILIIVETAFMNGVKR